jgi:hypothetical protein
LEAVQVTVTSLKQTASISMLAAFLSSLCLRLERVIYAMCFFEYRTIKQIWITETISAVPFARMTGNACINKPYTNHKSTCTKYNTSVPHDISSTFFLLYILTICGIITETPISAATYPMKSVIQFPCKIRFETTTKMHKSQLIFLW